MFCCCDDLVEGDVVAALLQVAQQITNAPLLVVNILFLKAGKKFFRYDVLSRIMARLGHVEPTEQTFELLVRKRDFSASILDDEDPFAEAVENLFVVLEVANHDGLFVVTGLLQEETDQDYPDLVAHYADAVYHDFTAGLLPVNGRLYEEADVDRDGLRDY